MSKKPTYEELEKRVLELEQVETECRSIEETLHESEKSYRNVFMNSHATMLVIDPVTADIVEANQAAATYYGWSRAELTAKKITDINTLAEKNVFREMKAAEADQHQFIFRHRLANGDTRDVEVFTGSIEYQGKQLLFSIIHDITKRKKAEQALLESMAYLDILFNETLSGTIVIDSETHKITDVNTTAIGAIGLPKEKIIGQVCHNFVFPAERGMCPIADLGQEVDKSERVLLTGGGKARTILKTVKTLEHEERSFYVESFIDISERKKAEQERERLIEELKKAVDEVKTLSGMLPICSSCKKIRDDRGYWNQIEGYIQKHSDASFSHGICPDCARRLYPELYSSKD